jgi:AhpD family alkylhydroperoxidase
MATAHETLHELQAEGRKLRDAIPGVYSGYARMSAAAMGDGELPAKVKELIALAIAVTRECDGCVAAHARGAAGRGATAQEVAEALGVAIMMNGGPGTVWGPRAYAAFQEYSAARRQQDAD